MKNIGAQDTKSNSEQKPPTGGKKSNTSNIEKEQVMLHFSTKMCE